MAPMSLLCNRFLKSLLIDEQKLQNDTKAREKENDVTSDDEDEAMNSEDDNDVQLIA